MAAELLHQHPKKHTPSTKIQASNTTSIQDLYVHVQKALTPFLVETIGIAHDALLCGLPNFVSFGLVVLDAHEVEPALHVLQRVVGDVANAQDVTLRVLRVGKGVQ